MIPAPYLLYLGHSADSVGIKTSRGLATFRREACVGEFRHDDCPLTLGLPRLTMAGGAAAGARTLVLGIANAGGRMDPALIADAAAGLRAGMNVASGLHHRLRDPGSGPVRAHTHGEIRLRRHWPARFHRAA